MTKDEKRRLSENNDLIDRMKNGYNLCHTPLSAYRFAPRPLIKKDPKAIARLYGDEKENG